MSYHIKEKTVSLDDLPATLKEESFNQPDYPVSIYPDNQTTFTSIFKLLVNLKRLGYTNLWIFAENGTKIYEDRIGFICISPEDITDNRPDKKVSQ